MLILGHRGVRSDDLRENTLEAFQRAVDLGADGIETDVRRTRDGRLVLFHDRLSPAGTPVAQLGHAALEAAAGHHVPELGEALAAWPDLLWDLEIKTPDFPGPLKRALSGRTGTRLILTSPHHEFLLAHGPDLGLPFGPVINHRPPSAEALLGPWRGSPPAYCVWNVDHLDGEILGAVREAGIDNLVYNLHTPADLETVREWGCRGAILDYPGMGVAWRLGGEAGEGSP